MIITITGGSGSGKSALGEAIAQRLEPNRKYYIATMANHGEEAARRIARHRELRRGKNFITIEQPTNLQAVAVPPDSTVLLECVSNLLANEMFSATCEIKSGAELQQSIAAAVEQLANRCRHLVIITNEIFGDGLLYDQTTTKYIKALAGINRRLFSLSQVCLEAVYSLPVFHKGALPWQL